MRWSFFRRWKHTITFILLVALTAVWTDVFAGWKRMLLVIAVWIGLLFALRPHGGSGTGAG